MELTLRSIAYHRNGISGMPFHAVLFTERRNGAEHDLVATVFDADCRVAVLDVGLLASGTVEFGVNSWRGDRYADWLGERIAEWHRMPACNAG